MRIFLTAATLAFAGIASAAAAQPAATAPDITPFLAREITPKVHLLTLPSEWYGPAIGNVILIEQSDGFVLIDSGFDAANGRAVVRYVKSLSPKPIKAVAITHWHNDHPLGVSAIRDAFPKVRIIATTGTEAGMRGPASYDVGYEPNAEAEAAVATRIAGLKAQYQKIYDDPATDDARKGRIRKALAQFDEWQTDFHGTYIVLPTETFDHQLLIKDRDTHVQLMFLGKANTEGDLVAWLPSERIVASGDIDVSPIPFGFGSYPADWIETIGKIKALPFRTLIPGHGDPQTDSAYLDKLSAAIADIRAQVGPLAKQGLSLDDVRKKVDFSKTAAGFGATSREQAEFQQLFADPMIENAYKEALGQTIDQGDLEGNPPPTFSEKAPPSRAIHHKN